MERTNSLFSDAYQEPWPDNYDRHVRFVPKADGVVLTVTSASPALITIAAKCFVHAKGMAQHSAALNAPFVVGP